MQFYNVKTHDFVDIDDQSLTKKKIVRTTRSGQQVRYAVRAEYKGTRLTKFINETTFRQLKRPEEH